MVTDAEALRAQFEAWATAAYRLSFDDDTPLKRYLWAAYQAGHAAAKAESAEAVAQERERASVLYDMLLNRPALNAGLESEYAAWTSKCYQVTGAYKAAIRAMRAQADSQPAPQQEAQEPVAWKHDCAALLQNDIELWVDRCPHCGKPRTTAAPVAHGDAQPMQPSDDDVICPSCSHQFRAIPVNVQKLMLDAGIAPPFTSSAQKDVAMDTFQKNGIAWAVDRWKSEVMNRPMRNLHRRSLDDAWRQVVRYFGGCPDTLLGPCHDASRAQAEEGGAS